MFFKGSRYQNVGDGELTDFKLRVIKYKRIRFIPPTRADWSYQVRQGDRLDLIAHDFFRDPERFWRICDVNRALWPDDLLNEVGHTILIPPSEG